MSPTFVGVLFFAIVLMAFWRVTLLILGAVLIAAIVTGLGIVPEPLDATAGPSPVIEQPLDGSTGPAVVPAR